ncbi:MAG: hypothetical protein ABF904_09730 [Ethanoligenens sp.]
MKKVIIQHPQISVILLATAFVLGGCAAAKLKPRPNATNSPSSIVSVNNSSSASERILAEKSSSSTPAAYRIDKTTLEDAKTDSDESLIGTSGLKHSYSYKQAIADGALVQIADAGTGYAIFNTAKFDNFIKHPTAAGIWVFHYILTQNTLRIHEMVLIQKTSTGFKDTAYDLSDGASSSEHFLHIVKMDWPDAIRYGMSNTNDSDDAGGRIMSFDKSCVYS